MEGKRLIEKIKLRNILSFGDLGEEITLEPLNIIIGQNASGKSNLVETLRLLNYAANGYFTSRMLDSGVTPYLWKGNYNFPIAEIEVYFDFPEINENLIYYNLKFAKVAQSFEIVEEEIAPIIQHSVKDFYYRNKNRIAELTYQETNMDSEDFGETIVVRIKESEYKPQTPILSSLEKHLTGYPVIRKIEEELEKVAIYEDWHFSRNQPPRQPIQFSSPSNFLNTDGSNLAIIIREFRHNLQIYEKVIENLRKVYTQVEKITPVEQGGQVQLYLQEKGMAEPIASSRFSNGTLRYLCLLAILCHPEPPPLICIEEPETGLHPDILPTIAELMKEASQRTQLIVTTHSDILVSAFSDMPEAVLVCEKDEDGTHFKRLNADELNIWMEDYKDLGEIWLRGGIGGTRW